MRLLAISLSTLTLVGCAAALVPATSDPQKKLMYAAMLFNKQDRPLPAERLIREAIDICKEKSDEGCLAKAYLEYGTLFRSNSVENWEKVYRRDGFQDKSATFDTRYEKSIEYFKKAEDIFEKHKAYDALTNTYLNMGFTYEWMKDYRSACGAYVNSLESYNNNIKINPNAHVIVPQKYDSFPDYLMDQKKRAGCFDLKP